MNTHSKKLSLDRFEPLNSQARLQAQELLMRGGELVLVKKDQVQIVRQGQKATIDTQGRVTWEKHLPQAVEHPAVKRFAPSKKPLKAKSKEAKTCKKPALTPVVTVVSKKLKAA